jgi:hypothetical protein
MTGRRGMLVGVLVALGLLAGGTAAQAAERECVGLIGPETIEGDLVVPPGEFCDLAGTRVLGNVFVREEAELIAQEADVRGNIEAERNSFVDLVDSHVGGTLTIRESFGTFVEGGSISGNVEGTGNSFVLLFGPSIAGNVKLVGGTGLIAAEDLEVGGTLEAVEPALFDLFDSTVNGNFYVRGALEGSIFCGNTLNGDTEFTDNRELLVIGSPASNCDGNTVNGTVEVRRNEADIEISDNDIGGNLKCFRNTPPPTGGGNRVEGNKEGQCAAL